MRVNREFLKSRLSMSTIRAGVLAGGALLFLLTGGALGYHTAKASADSTVATPPAAIAVSPATLSTSFETVAKVVEPAVVNINTEQIIHNTSSEAQDPFREFFGHNSPFGSFFGNVPRDLKQRSLGSGFVVDSKGYILTNNHVVENATKIRVKLADGRTMDAKVVGTDPQTDLAVLKVDASGLPVLTMADSERIQVGDWVLAFGSPFGLTQTMTAGIVSAKGRVIGAGPYDNFLQTDAAINPGNSGGPLVDLQGRVVGINTMIASESGGFQGVGFAIPSSMAQNVYGQIVKNGKVTRGWLGVQIQPMTPELARSFAASTDKGVLVAEVESGSPAERAGLKSGDVITSYNGQAVHSPQDLSIAVAATPVDSAAKVAVLRDGKPLTLDVKVGLRADNEAGPASSKESEDHGKLGITVENVTPDAARAMNLDVSHGALVTEVKPGSPADENGIRPGDVISEINHMPVNNVNDLLAVTRNLKSGATVLLRVQRQGGSMYMAFELS